MLLGTGALASLASFLYPALRYIIPPLVAESGSRSVVAGKVGELKRNTGTIFKFGEKPGLLVNTADGELKAYSAVCSHLSCTVQYRDDLREIWCACHNGKYDLNGRNVSGPPPRPLDEYRVVVKGDEVIISKKA